MDQSAAASDKALPPVFSIRPRHWIALTLALMLMAVAVTTYWKHQADRARDELRQNLAAVQTMNRQQMLEAWQPKVDWTPASDSSAAPPAAPEALAVLPRSKHMDFDAIFVLFRGDRVAATLALTSIGGYYNGQPLSLRDHPDTLIGQRLSDAQRGDLELLIRLLEQRLTALDPQTDRYTWTREVTAIARDLLRRQEMKNAKFKMQSAK